MSILALRIMVVDEDVLRRGAVAEALRTRIPVEVMVEAGRLDEVEPLIGSQPQPLDIALIAFLLPDGTFSEVRTLVQAYSPACHMLVTSVPPDRLSQARVIASGAAGCVTPDSSVDELAHAIRTVALGHSLIPHQERLELIVAAAGDLARVEALRVAIGRLTKRERELLQSLIRGQSDKETAREWGVSSKTVAAHTASVLDKLGVDSRLEAVLIALQFGVVSLGSFGLGTGAL